MLTEVKAILTNLQLVKVNDEVKKSDGTTKEIPSVANTKKTNLGTKLKRSAADMTKNEYLPDFSGSPTLDEWNRYIVGTAILATTMRIQPLEEILFSSTLVLLRFIMILQVLMLSDSGNFTYNYTPKIVIQLENSVINLTWIQNDALSNSDYGTSFEKIDYIDLTFSDFYNGDYKEIWGKNY